MNLAGKIRQVSAVAMAALMLLLTACSDPDANSFRSLNLVADATLEGDVVVPAIKVMVVGDVASPRLADYLTTRGYDVTDVPYVDYEASAVAMDGDYIVWVDDRNGGNDIYGYQISTATEFPISTATGSQVTPKISGDYVVWGDSRNGNWDIYGYRFSTEAEFAITTANRNQRYPEIDGDYVVWQDERNNEADIYAYRISTGTEITVSTAVGEQWLPQISGDYIVWQSYLAGDSDIDIYRISTGSLYAQISAAGGQYMPVVSGNYVAWVDNRNSNDDIYAYNLNTKTEFEVSAAAGQQWRPQISGEYVVWQDYRNGDADVYGYHFASDTEFVVSNRSGSQQSYPAIKGDTIAWQDGRSGNFDIYTYSIASGQEQRRTSHVTDQTRPLLVGSRIAWLDGRRGLVDVMFRNSINGSDQLATSSWTTPAGAVLEDLSEYGLVVFGSDVFSDEVVLDLFDAANSAGINMLGLGGTGRSLASALAAGGRYGISVDTSCSGQLPMRLIANVTEASDHAIFSGLDVSQVLVLESDLAATKDELAIDTNAGDPASPADWQLLASFSPLMCNAAEPAVVEFTTAEGTKVILDGSATVADGYAYWSSDRWTMLSNAASHLAVAPSP